MSGANNNMIGKARKSLLLAMAAMTALATLPATAQEPLPEGVKKITILQVNDVYQEEPVDHGTRGGLARVATLRKEVMAKQPNTLFMLGGDTLSPSVASNTFKGQQMVACWNALGVDYAVFGNHEFDFGPEVLIQRMKESKFKWICANVIDKRTGKTFADVPPYDIVSVGGIKLGVIGLLTPDTVRSSHAGPNIDILDPAETAKKYVPEMRAKGAQVVVALTHLTMGTDKSVAWAAPIDAIAGGHEHVLMESVANGTPILKSGSDARNVGRIDINYSTTEHKVQSVDLDVLPVTDKIKDDPSLREVINKFESSLSKELNNTIAATEVELDATQVDNQTQETNLADYIADAYRKETKSDVALFNGGSIRSNTIYPPGNITRRDVLSMLPFENPIVKIEVPGKIIRQALEHGVSIINIRAGGRLAQVSGMSYEYDARKQPGERLLKVMVGGAPLQDDKVYTMATNNFVAEGGDAYTMFKGLKRLITAEEGATEATVFLNALMKDKVVTPKTDGRIKRIDLPK